MIEQQPTRKTGLALGGTKPRSPRSAEPPEQRGARSIVVVEERLPIAVSDLLFPPEHAAPLRFWYRGIEGRADV